MLSASSEDETLRLGTNVAMRLLAWQQHSTPLDWFDQDLKRDPLVEGFVVPRSIRWRRTRRDFSTSLQVSSLLAAAAWVIKRSIGSA